MKQIEIAGNEYQILPVTLRQAITLQSAFALWQKIGGGAVNLDKLGAVETKAFADVVAAILSIDVNTVLDWPLAQTLNAATIAGHAFLAVNGPYLGTEVVPAIEQLTTLGKVVTAALNKAA